MTEKHKIRCLLLRFISITSVIIAFMSIVIGCIKITECPLAVPIKVTTISNNVGSIQFELVYDAEVLQVNGVKTGSLSKNAIMDFNVENPGRVVIGIVDDEGIKQDSSVIVTFKVLEHNHESTLVIQNVIAHSADTLKELVTSSTDGKYAGKPDTVVSPVIIFK